MIVASALNFCGACADVLSWTVTVEEVMAGGWMARTHHCHSHAQRPVVAYCEQCARPCCRDCTVELFDQTFCPRCKKNAVDTLERHAVVPDALNAALVGALGVMIFGFVLGPYAIWRARTAAKMVERAPWFRGMWHIRAAYMLGAIATLSGVITLLGKTLGQG